MTNASIKQAHIIVNLGHGAHGRTGVMGRALLVNGDSGGETVDMVDVWFLHLIQKLTSIGRQGLDIATLPLGKNGVEGQATLPRTRQAGNDYQAVTRNRDIYIFQVMFAGTTYDNL